jgi:hypothetical protein
MNAGPHPAGIFSSFGEEGGVGNGDRTIRAGVGHGLTTISDPPVHTGHGCSLAREVAHESAMSARIAKRRVMRSISHA